MQQGLNQTRIHLHRYPENKDETKDDDNGIFSHVVSSREARPFGTENVTDSALDGYEYWDAPPDQTTSVTAGVKQDIHDDL